MHDERSSRGAPEGAKVADHSGGLEQLAEHVRSDLERIAHPRMAWLTPRALPDGSKAFDVLIVGAGQSGIATAFGLKRAKVDNVLVVDKAPRGREGPWLTYARMRTLRSPKDYTGPDLDLPNLTYQSWHIAKYGEANWDALGMILREDWAAYLLWMRDTTGIQVSNETEVVHIEPAYGVLGVRLKDQSGHERTVHARKVVLATGQEGAGLWWMPPLVAALPAGRRSHAADDIDFGALAGRRVAVLGAGASAFDNAAVALESGAERVTLFCRRERPQVIQPYRWLTFRGFLAHLGDLDDPWRWRFMRHILALREGFPQETYDRCARHAQFELVTGAPWNAADLDGDEIVIDTPKGVFKMDHVIAGTGVEMDFSVRPELQAFQSNIASWSDQYTPPENERDARLGRFPYLSPEFSFTEKEPGQTPWIQDIHLFSIASTMSFGPSGSSINAMTTVVPKLVGAVTRGLFKADVEQHWRSLQTYDVPQAIVPGEGSSFGGGGAG